MTDTPTSDDEYNSELPPQAGLASALPESLTGAIALPPHPAAAARAGVVVASAGHPATHPVHPATPAEPAPALTSSVEIDTASIVPAALADAAALAENAARRGRGRPMRLGDAETPAMLTADRLIEVNRKTRRPPRGGWNRFVYSSTFHLVNRGDSAKVRARLELDERIQKQFDGGTRFVPVLTRKGGVGKTTVTTLLGMALADARNDRVIAIDANPDRGTLSERIAAKSSATVRDVVSKAPSIGGFTDFSAFVSRDDTRLDVLASDSDPMLSEAFDENDYNVVADLASRYYSLALTDCGTGIVHSVMRATLQRADSIVIVSGGSVDEAKLASETLTWLDSNGYGDLVSNAVVALNTATQGTNLVKLEEIESHFHSRVRQIVRIPYDPQLAAGSVVTWDDLKPITRFAARTLAALVVEGMPATRTL